MIKKKQKTEKANQQHPWQENFKTLLYALIIAGVFRSFFFEPFHIPSGSMKGNLLEGDFILVSKYSYGYSEYSFPLGIIPFNGRIMAKQPKRGDVIVFRLPRIPTINFIKRVIGLPGDKIQVRNGVLFINGIEVPRVITDSFRDPIRGEIDQYIETLPNGKEIKILEEFYNTPKDNTAIYEVPEGHYFFMGDNRDNSEDSRYVRSVGFVPFQNLVGRADYIFMSSEDSLLKFWKWPTSIRWRRIFSKI